MNISGLVKSFYQKLLEKKKIRQLNKKLYSYIDYEITNEAPCTKPIVFGVIGTGHVFDRFMNDMNMLDCNISVKALCRGRSKAANAKAEKYKIPVVYDTYEEMLNDEEINAIYVATPNNLHKQHSMQALRAGKNVLCEKPVAVNYNELTEMYKCADENDCFLMEGMWTRTLPIIKKLREVVDGGAVGDVRLLQTKCFNSNSPTSYPAMFSKEKAGGALMDVGCYGLHFADLIAGSSKIVNSCCELYNDSVDKSSMTTLISENGTIVTVAQSICAQGGAVAFIHGESGYIEIPMFLSPSEFTVYRNGAQPKVYCYKNSKEKRPIGYAYEIVHFADCIRLGSKDSLLIPREKSLQIAEKMQKIRYDCNIIFDSEA